MAPIERITSLDLKAKIEVLGHGHVLKRYKRNKNITHKHSKLVMRDACLLGFETFGFHMAKKSNMVKLGTAIKNLFPENYPTLDTLVPDKGRTGSLYYAALYRLDQERQNRRELVSDEDVAEDEAEEIPEVDMEEQIRYLKTACGSHKKEIEEALNKTSNYRRDLILSGAVSVTELLFSFFLSHPGFISHDFNLIYPTAKTNLQQNRQKMDIKLLSSLENEYKPAKKRECLIVPDDVQPFLILFRLIGHDITKKVDLRDNFVTAFSRILEFIPHNTPVESISQLSTNTQPFLVAKYSTDQTNITQYCLVFHPHVVPLDANMTFFECFKLVFQLFHLYNLEYPFSVQKFYKFFEEFIFEIKEHNLPKTKLINHKILQKLNELNNVGTDNSSSEALDVPVQEISEEELSMEIESLIDGII